jgi:hypothetical protein
MRKLRALGYWREPQYEWRADTREHVCIGWAPGWTATPQAIISALGPSNYDATVPAYLRNGELFETYRGLSHCRFECGVSNREMGFREYADGIWVWPEGLVHYIGKHQLPLPPEFLETVSGDSGQPPRAPMSPDTPIDREFWETWFVSVTANHG